MLANIDFFNSLCGPNSAALPNLSVFNLNGILGETITSYGYRREVADVSDGIVIAEVYSTKNPRDIGYAILFTDKNRSANKRGQSLDPIEKTVYSDLNKAKQVADTYKGWVFGDDDPDPVFDSMSEEERALFYDI